MTKIGDALLNLPTIIRRRRPRFLNMQVVCQLGFVAGEDPVKAVICEKYFRHCTNMNDFGTLIQMHMGNVLLSRPAFSLNEIIDCSQGNTSKPVDGFEVVNYISS